MNALIELRLWLYLWTLGAWRGESRYEVRDRDGQLMELGACRWGGGFPSGARPFWKRGSCETRDVDTDHALLARRYLYLRDTPNYDSEVICLINHAAYGEGRIPPAGLQFLNGEMLDDAVDEGIELRRRVASAKNRG